jgi:ribosomal protein S12 methylthiotransferase accessory factor
MLSQAALKPSNPEPLADPAVCDPVTGIIQKCFELPTEPEDPRVFCFVTESADIARFRTGLVKSSRFGCGVGLTRAWAAGAAIGEAVERYSAAVYDHTRVRFASFAELDEEAVPPESFALYSPGQYAAFQAAGRTAEQGGYEPFTRDTQTGWVRGLNLTTGRPVLVPAPFVYLPYRYRPGEPYIVDSISSGCAAGRSRADATLKALYEVVERDAISIAWYNRLSLPRIELEGDDALGRLFRERFACPQFRYTLVDSTLDLPIPTFIGFLTYEPTGTLCASATRLSPLEAATKTLLEAAQGVLAWKRELLYGPPERFQPDFSDVVDFNQHSKVYMRPGMRRHLEFLWGSGDPPLPLDRLPNRASGDPEADLRTSVRLLAGRGLEVIAVDITSEDVLQAGYHVVRVVIPGVQVLNARHDSPLLGGRRLYDVPVEIGRRERPLREDELNLFLHPYP